MTQKLLSKRMLMFIVSISILFFANGLAQSNDDCLMCHDDNSFTMDKDGKEVSIYVNAGKFSSSSHSKLKCVSCHTNFDPESIPHAKDLTPKACGDCHQKQIVKHLFHPNILKASGREKGKDVNCLNCHDNHYTQDPNAEGSRWSSQNIPTSCGQCHTEIKNSYLSSEHYSALKKECLGPQLV